MDGSTLNDITTRRTGKVVIDQRCLYDVNIAVRWFTQGTVCVRWDGNLWVVGGQDDNGLPVGSGMRKPCAYLVGAALAYARHSGALIPEPIVLFLREVQETYREGLTHRYADEEARGAEHARLGWLRTSEA